ncbi:MAG: hypothetical protein HY840_11685 [Bacteroidetes bacterium]|nr:hypothetical protein [Bacteroidota bacterium]
MKKHFIVFAYCLFPLFPSLLGFLPFRESGEWGGVRCFSQDFTPQKPADSTAAKGKPPFWSWDKVYGGGGLGLQFGTFTLINIAPDIGYKLTDKFSAGIGIRYIYLGDNTVVPTYKMNVYGASVFSRYLITDFLFAHAEYETLNGPWSYYNDRRSFLTNMWVGGGLRQHAGNASMNIMALWNLNDTPNNPFPNPQIRVGIGIGL